MHTKTTNKFRQVTQAIEHFGLKSDVQVLALLQTCALNPENSETYKALWQVILNSPVVKAKRMRGIPFQTPTPEKETPESIRIGHDENKKPYYIRVSELIKVLFIAGKIGLGKTTVILNILSALCSKNNARWLAVDYKRDIRGISRELIKHSPLVFLRFSLGKTNFKFNPLQRIPGISIAEQDIIFSNILSETTFLRDGAQYILLQHLAELRKQKKNPTIQELINSIRKTTYKTFREKDWQASSLRALTSLLASFPEMLDYAKGINIIEMLETNTVLEMDNAGDFKSFWPSLITAYLIKHRINQNIRNTSAPPFIISIDEGNFLFSKDIKEKSYSGTPVINGLLELGREFGIGWIIASNTPNLITQNIKSNASTKILLHLGDWRNIKDMSDSMGLSPKQSQHTLTFKPGDAVIKKESQKAHKITLDNAHLEKEIVFDDEIDEISQTILDSHEAVPASEEKIEKKPELSILQKELLLHIKEHPDTPKTKHPKAIGIASRSKAKQLFDSIKKLFLEITIPNGKGRPSIHLALTKEGYAELGITYSGTRGAEVKHDFLVRRYTEQLNGNGYTARPNFRLKGESADIGIEFLNKIVAVEICDTTTANWEIKQLVRNLCNAGFCKSIIVCTKTTKANSLQQKITQLPKELQDKATVTPIINDITTIIKEVLL